MLTTNLKALAQLACLFSFFLLQGLTLPEDKVGLNVNTIALGPVGENNFGNNELFEEKYSFGQFWKDLKYVLEGNLADN